MAPARRREPLHHRVLVRGIAERFDRQSLEPLEHLDVRAFHTPEQRGQAQPTRAGDRSRIEAVSVGHALEPVDAAGLAARDELEAACGFLVAGRQMRQDVFDGPAVLGAGPEDLALRQAADERQGRFANRGDASERLTPPRRQRGRSSGCHDGPTLDAAAGEVNWRVRSTARETYPRRAYNSAVSQASSPASTFMAIAHRGASSYAPENTMAAFDLAIVMGARHIELDVHSTSDGHVVVIHDDTVDRTTDGSGPVAKVALAALRTLDAGSWFGHEFTGERIPTLDAVLGRYRGRVHVHVEIKGQSSQLSHQTADLIRKHGMVGEATITSFQFGRLQETRAYAPELTTGWLVADVTDAVIAQARSLGLSQICPRANRITSELVRRLRAAGFVVRAWGVASEDLMRQVVQAGADGMTVNFPDKLITYLAMTTRSLG